MCAGSERAVWLLDAPSRSSDGYWVERGWMTRRRGHRPAELNKHAAAPPTPGPTALIATEREQDRGIAA